MDYKRRPDLPYVSDTIDWIPSINSQHCRSKFMNISERMLALLIKICPQNIEMILLVLGSIAQFDRH